MHYYASERLRIGRYSEPGQLYLLTCQVEKRAVVFDDLWLARQVIQQFRLVEDEGLVCSLAWVVMPDHIHWLIELKHGELSTVMQRFKSRSARAVNRVRHCSGQLWQTGFHDRALRREENIRHVARYLVANPLRAGLVQTLRNYPHWDAIWL